MKTINCLVLSIIFMFFLGGFKTNRPFSNMFPEKNQIPESDEIMIEIMDHTTEEIVAKHKLIPSGFGMSGQGKFSGVSLNFHIDNKLEKNEARSLLLECVEIFLENINQNEKIRSHLTNYPFTEKNIGITIYIREENQKVFHPNICVACWYSKGVYFRTNDPESKYGYKETTEETHKEALELVKQYRASQVAHNKDE